MSNRGFGTVRAALRFTIFASAIALSPAGCISPPPSKQDVHNNWEQQRAALKTELASAELKRGRSDSALQLAQEALGLSPQNPANVELLARTYLAKGDFASARSLLEAARPMHPTAANLAYLLGAVYERERNWALAGASHAEACRIDPAKLEYRIAWAQSLAHGGDSAAAVATMREVEAEFRDQPAYFLTLAEIQRRAGDLGGACDAYRGALQLGYDSPATREALGLCLYWLGRYDEALAHLEPLARSGRELSGALSSAYAGSLLGTHDAARAESWLTVQTRKRLDDAGLWMLLAQARLELDRPSDAVDAARFATRMQPQSVDAWCTLGEALLRGGHRADARDATYRALTIKPDCAEALLLADALRGDE